jgi:hypothetical protein
VSHSLVSPPVLTCSNDEDFDVDPPAFLSASADNKASRAMADGDYSTSSPQESENAVRLLSLLKDKF